MKSEMERESGHSEMFGEAGAPEEGFRIWVRKTKRPRGNQADAEQGGSCPPNIPWRSWLKG